MKRLQWKRCLALTLSAAMIIQYGGTDLARAKAAEANKVTYLEEATMPAEISVANTFYVGTSSADLQENADGSYAMKIGRGGSGVGEASVVVKLSDATAKYGTDYKVRTLDGGVFTKEKADSPKDNESLMEMIAGQKITEEELIDSETEESKLDETYNQITEQAKEQYEKQNASQQEKTPVWAKEMKQIADSATGQTATGDHANNPLAQAKQDVTGVATDRKDITSTKQDMTDVLSEGGDYLTQMVQGATLPIEFADGETEKYIEIIPIDNDKSDGDRTFYATLSDPSEGMTNSAVSESILTIKDDEPVEMASVGFDQASYDAKGSSVSVRLVRSGAMTQTVSVHMTTEEGSAVESRDYSQVDAEVTFPFGVKERTVQIPVDTQYLNDKAEFGLKITKSSGAEVNESSSAKVVLTPDAKTQETDTTADTSSDKKEVSGQASESDVLYANALNMANCGYRVRGSGSSWTYMSGNSFTLDVNNDNWVDGAIHLSGNWNQTAQYIYDGFTFNWSKNSGKSSWSGHNVSFYREGEWSDAYIFTSTGDDPRFGGNDRTYYFGDRRAADVKFYLENHRGKGNYLYINSLKPILRPFKVSMKAADKLSYLTGSGDTKAEDPDATSSTLTGGRDGSNLFYNNYMMVINANSQSGKSRLTGARIVNGNKSTLISSRFYSGFHTGDKKLQVVLNNDFCKTYDSYITYSNAGNRRLTGGFTIQPVYEKIKCTVEVQDNDAYSMDGKLTLNGTAKSKGTYSYYYGDILNVSNNDVGADFRVLGVSKYAYNTVQNDKARDNLDYINGARKIQLNTATTILTPICDAQKNAISIRVNTTDKSKFKKTGIFSDQYIKDHGVEKDGFLDIKLDVDTVEGREYLLTADTVDGYQPVWKETNGNKYYVGSIFRFIATALPSTNRIYLYPGQNSTDYTAIKGKMYYDSSTINRPNESGSPILPAEGGYLSFNSQAAIVGQDGTVQTNAFHPVKQITVNNKTISFGAGSGKTPLYIRAIAGASGASESCDIQLALSGSKTTVSNGSSNVSSFMNNMNNISIRVNKGDGPYFASSSVTCVNNATDTVYMNDKRSVLSVVVANNTSAEKVKAVSFLIYDKYTGALKLELEAAKKSDGVTWTAGREFKKDDSESSYYAAGDRVFVQMTTTKASTLTSNSNVSLDIGEGAMDALSQTVYAPVNTGYTFVKDKSEGKPINQNMDFGSLNGLGGLPLVGSFNSNLNLGPVQLSVKDLYDDQKNIVGTRVQIGLDMDFDKTSLKSDNSDLADDGMNYGSKLDIIKNLKESVGAAWSNVLGSKALDSKGLASMGAQKWGIHPAVGFYMDFATAYEKDGTGAIVSEHYKVQGGGIYLGGNASYSVAWYALIPVVYIPCYFGVAGDLTLSMNAGGTTNVTNTETDPDEYMATSHNITESLAFDFQFAAAAQVQVYCGVGICGTLGVRGGMSVDTNFLWYPTLHKQNSYFDEIGYDFMVTFQMWVDLLIYTLEIPVYTIGDKDASGEKVPYSYKLLKQYSDLEGKSENQIDQFLSDLKPTKSKEALKKAKEEEQLSYQVKDFDQQETKWYGDLNEVNPGDVHSMATFKEESSEMLLGDGYDRPEAKLLDMGDKGTLLVFLKEQSDRTDQDKVALVYSVYKDGVYSAPQVIQKDATADFQPNLCDAGDSVIISWISSPAGSDKSDEKKYLESQEVYSVKVSKTDLSALKEVDQKGITRLTDDEWYDSQPNAVYDEQSGEYNVYYVKTAPDTDAESYEATDLANPMNVNGKTYSTIAYRVNQPGQGWLVDQYSENEKPTGYTDEKYREQLLKQGGQRFLSSPIAEEDIEDPLIYDFQSVSYNGIGVYAYTIDKDNSADTDEDRDLFIQLYDFSGRTTYVPIRITNDDVADSSPQLIRRGTDASGTTYLFWKSEDELHYIDVSSLVKYGVDDNGQILESAMDKGTDEDSDAPDEDIYAGMTKEEEAKATYRFEIGKVTNFGEAENQNSTYTQYQVVTDAEDNLYVTWIGNGTDNTQELFATAMIDSDIQETDNGKTSVKGWAPANQLTNAGKYCDDPALAITESGELMIVYNQYDIEVTGEGDAAVAGYKDMQFRASHFKPYGSVEAQDITVSDTTPEAGQDIEVSMKFANTGLTASKNGFAAKIYLKAADGTKTLIKEYDSTESIVPGQETGYSFTYTVDDKTVGSSIYVETVEKDQDGTNYTTGETFEQKAEYVVEQNDAYQGADSKFYAKVVVSNTGNDKSKEGDALKVRFTGPYSNPIDFGITKTLLASRDLSLAPGETTEMEIPLDIPASAFQLYSKVECTTSVVDKEDNLYGEGQKDMIYMSQPAELTLNGNQNLEMNEGESVDAVFNYAIADSITKVTPMISSDNEAVAIVEDGKIVATGEGTAVVTAIAAPYNAMTSIQVHVKGTQNDNNDSPNTEATAAPSAPAPTANATVSVGKGKIAGVNSYSKTKATVTWNKVASATGYELTYAADKAFTKSLKSITVTGTKKTITLNSKKTYYVKVRAIAAQNVYGEYSDVRSVKLTPRPAKTGKVTVKAGKKSVTVTGTKVKNSTGIQVVVSSNKAGTKVVATKTGKKKVTIAKLKSGKKYYVIIRNYKETSNKNRLFSNAKVMKVKTK